MGETYYGHSTGVLENAYLRLEYLKDAGPRIVRLGLADSGTNLLAEVPDVSWATPYGDYYPLGGHRLWHAPESFPRTHVPDAAGVAVERLPGGVCLSQPEEDATGIRKSMAIELCADRAEVEIRHILANHGLWPVELAPWAITQLRLGGVALLSQRADAATAGSLLPDRHVVLWPYSSWQDPRLHLTDDHIAVDARPGAPALKVGCMSPRGWIGYLVDEVFLVKRFRAEPDKPHVDRGCNAEIYCGDAFVEIETLGPLVRLRPGQAVTHTETWSVWRCPGVLQDVGSVRELAASLAL